MAVNTKTVIVTGASAGVGRAVARRFAARGWRVGLLARGEEGLEAAAADVERAGGAALAVPVDMAIFPQVQAAASTVEQAFGPIDVWVNDAFTSVFAPFWEISPAEFKRVTEVCYLGYVNGTHVALDRMRPRDYGTIVQVGSALSERSIPLQSAYCGAKHAINGFTSSLRCELLHEKSGVKITVVQLPAVNTPQFTWVLSRLNRHPQPVPPIYEPEVIARAIAFAADHPRQRQYLVGASTVATLMVNRLVPALLDRYLARHGFSSQQADQPRPDQGYNLWQPVDSSEGRDFGSHGEFDDAAHPRSLAWWAREHARMLAVAGVLPFAVAAAGNLAKTAKRARR